MKFGPLGVSVQCTQGTFTGVQGQSEVIWCILYFQQPSLYLASDWSRRAKTKIWASGVSIQCIQDTFES